MALLADVPEVLAGRKPDDTGAARGLLLAVGVAVLGKVKDDYVTKSEGGTGSDGVSWEPLSAVTLALRRVRTDGLKKLKADYAGLGRDRRRLVDEQRRRLERLLLGDSPGARAQRKMGLRLLDRRYKAGAVSESEYERVRKLLLRQSRQETAEAVAFAGALALILRDTDRTLNSLTPGLGGSDQHLQAGPGWVEIGSNVAHFKYHQSKRPRKMKRSGRPVLPRRQVLPDQDEPLPESYRQTVTDTVHDGLRGEEFWRTYLRGRVS